MKKTVRYISWFMANIIGLGVFTSLYINVLFPTSSLPMYTVKMSVSLIVWVAITSYFVQKWSLFSVNNSKQEVSS